MEARAHRQSHFQLHDSSCTDSYLQGQPPTETPSSAPHMSSVHSLTQLTVEARVSWLTHTQELGDAIFALAAVQAGLRPALINLCKSLGRGKIR